MKKLMNNMKSFMQDEEGVTAIEYGLIAALIAVAIVTIVGVIGDDLNAVFTRVSTELKNALL